MVQKETLKAGELYIITGLEGYEIDVVHFGERDGEHLLLGLPPVFGRKFEDKAPCLRVENGNCLSDGSKIAICDIRRIKVGDYFFTSAEEKELYNKASAKRIDTMLKSRSALEETFLQEVKL